MKLKHQHHKISYFLLYVLSICFLYSCSGKKQLVSSSSSDSPVSTPVSSRGEPESYPYFVYKDGSYIEAELDKKPEVIGGLESMYHSIRYPAYAREHGIQGTVIITVIVNEFGQLEDAVITQRVGGGCDEEAFRIVKLRGEQGFEPAELNSMHVKVRYGMPIRFILQRK